MSDRAYAKAQVQQKTLSGSSPKSSLLQRTCACGQHTIAGGECSTCRSKQSTLLRFQRTLGSSSTSAVTQSNSPTQENVLPFNAAGDRLSRFGHDFSKIPVYSAQSPMLQTKLKINQPGDEYEQEADRVADQVMTTPAHHSVSGAPAPIQRFAGQPTGPVEATPASVDQALASPGRPLESALRQDMEQRFGYDFSRVRVHSGSEAEQSVQDVNAHAFTVGYDVVFGTGRFAPETYEGRRLIAHELTHVVQQSGAQGIDAGQEKEKFGLSPTWQFGYSPTRPLHLLRQTAQASLQRQADFGLATSQNVSGFAAKVKAYQSNKANQSKSFEDLTGYAVGVLNDELQAIGIPPIVKWEVKPILGAAAQFKRLFWTMTINSTGYTGKSGLPTIGQLTKQQVTDLAQFIYHEARHAEQDYRIAQFLAGQGKPEAEIAYEASIPKDIAKQAKAKPLTAIEPAEKVIAIYVGEEIDKALGDDPKDISKRTQDYRKVVAEHNQEVRQVQDWYQDMPLNDLIYDHDYKIRGALFTVQEEVKKRKKGSWDTSKLQPAVDVLKKDVIPQFETEITRLSPQRNRSNMVTHLVSLRNDLIQIVDLVEQQTRSQTLIIGLDLIELDARKVIIELDVAYNGLLAEADAYTQQDKVTAAMKGK